MYKQRVLCVGMCVVDVIHVCSEYPIEDSDKSCLNGYLQRGGNASNCCTVLRQLSADCEFLGILSNLDEFLYLTKDCNRRVIYTENCPRVPYNPPISSIILNQRTGTRTIIHNDNKYPILTYKVFQKLDLSLYEWIHFEGRNVGQTLQMIDMINEYNRKLLYFDAKIKISVELELCDRSLIPLCAKVDYIFLSKSIATYMGWSTSSEAVKGFETLVKNMQKTPYKYNIICPWGSKDVAVMSSVDGFQTVPAVKVQHVVDSLGAGDTFIAGFIFATSRLQMSLLDAIEYANKIAAAKIQQFGYDHLKHVLQNKLETSKSTK